MVKDILAYHILKWMNVAVPEIIFFSLVARDEGGFRIRLEKFIGGDGLQQYKSYSIIALLAIGLYTYSTDLALTLWKFSTSKGMNEAITSLSLLQTSILTLLTFSVVFSIVLYYMFGKRIEGKHYAWILVPIVLFLGFIMAL